MVSICPLIANSSSPLSKTCKCVPITTGITVTFMFHSICSSLTWSSCLYLDIYLIFIQCFALLLLLLFTPLEFFTSVLADGFHWSLSDSNSPQVSRTRLRILAVLSNAVVWIVFTRPPTSKSSRPFNNALVIVPKASITIGTIVTFMFHSFINSLARSRYLSFFSHSFRFILRSAGTAKLIILQIISFFFCWLLSGLVFWPGLGDPFES